MRLEDVVLTELEGVNLNGAKITNLVCEVESTNISFELYDMKIDFVATGDNDFEVTTLQRGEQVYTDEATLDKCSDWARYIWIVVNPIVKKHRPDFFEITSDEATEEYIENMDSTPINEQAEVVSDEHVEEVMIDENPEENISDEQNEETVNEAVAIDENLEENVSDVKEEAGTNEESEEKALDELDKALEKELARVRKEGYNEAKKKNSEEIKDLTKKYNFILFFTIVVLMIAFVLIWIFFGG